MLCYPGFGSLANRGPCRFYMKVVDPLELIALIRDIYLVCVRENLVLCQRVAMYMYGVLFCECFP